MTDIYKKLEHIAQELFGQDKVHKTNYSDPEVFDIRISPNSNVVRSVEVYLYNNEKKYFMLIDDFRFEYNDLAQASAQIEKYMHAISSGHIHVKSWNILGLKVNSKLIIE